MPKIIITNDIFIQRARKVHGDLYDYSNVCYKNNHSKVKIICKEHGVFEQSPQKHWNGQGCLKCAGRMNNIEDFVNKALKIHKDKYDYSLVDFQKIKNNLKVKIICKEHGVFEQIPSSHISGMGCPCCGKIKRSNSHRNSLDKMLKKFKKVHGNRYDYSLVKYKRIDLPIKIICKEHGVFEQIPDNHLAGKGCPKCAGQHLTNEDFINICNKVHNNKYDYSKVKFKDIFTKVCIICPKHGEFWQTPNNHKNNARGCPGCQNSNGERKIERWLIENNINFVRQKRFKKCRYKLPLPFDFYLTEQNICIEYDGEQHFKPFSFIGKYQTTKEDFFKQKIKDEIKNKYCKNNNIKLLRINFNQNINEILENEFC